MSTENRDNPNVYKLIAIICLILIPLAGGIGIVFDINRDPIQLLIMALSFSILSWINWSRYKEKSIQK
ncbi:hypothetical protein [Halalkalibacterium ligniniphilum]|uniref:hypothetical protein n=1 Tax=Halalkalibacterium ligniniphilum TaxID=1134413 RepID=UPI0003822BDC|nr:hypothetical protein [Halalkalibacterium ligniniphilum]